MSIYELLLARKKLRVQLKRAEEGKLYKKPFTVQPLLMMGDSHYTTASSEWARFARVGGVTINRTRRHQMREDEMKEWCERLVLLEIIEKGE